MKFTVEVEDFYLEEGELAAELKKQIKDDVVSQIRENVKQQVSTFMDGHIKDVINVELKTRVQMLMDDFMASGKVDSGEYGKKEAITVKDWVAKYFGNKHPEIVKFIEKSVNSVVIDIQKRYDMLFASQLITKIKDAGFLKDEAAKMLLQEDKN